MTPTYIFKHLLLNTVLMMIVIIAITIVRGGIANLYGDSWFVLLLMMSVVGGAICGALLMTFVMPRDIDFSPKDILTYSALFFVLIGGYMQGMMMLEWILGDGNHQKFASTILVAVLYILGRSVALQLMPPEKWTIKPKHDDPEMD